jgi:putative membrane protein
VSTPTVKPDATELAVDRTWLAYERTLMAWVRTATSMISFGFSIYKFFQFEKEETGRRVSGFLLRVFSPFSL